MKNIIYQFFRHPLIAIPVVGVIIFLATWGIDVRIINRLPPYSYAMVTRDSVPGTITLVGTVAPSEEIDMAFLKSGNVASVGAHTGQNIKAGTVLASLSDQGTLGQLNQAKGAFEAAEANYKKIINGATGTAVDVAKSAVNAAQVNLDGITKQQNLLVASAHANLLNSTLATILQNVNSSSIPAPLITGTYAGDTEGSIIFTVNQAGTDGYVTFSGIESGTTSASTTAPQALGDTGLYLEFSSIAPYVGTSWTINIPNKNAPNYLTNYNAYQTALGTQAQTVSNAQAALDQANASLTALKSVARPEDIETAQAQVDSAQGAYQAAQSAYDNNFIKAPINGTITFVNVEVGQNATPNQTIIGMVPANAFQMVAYVDQDFLNRLPLGTQVSVTFTEIPGTTFSARVVDTESGSAVAQSNAQYKVTFELDGADSRIHTGLNASILLIGKDRENVLVVPRSALLMQNGSYFVLVKKGGSLVDTPISVGLVGTEKVEVISGIVEGDTVALIGV